MLSDPNEFSQSDMNGRPSNSSVLHSQSDMMLSSAVKLASESSFKIDKSTNQLVNKKKKKKANKKKKVAGAGEDEETPARGVLL